jgi:hypothetical protein
MCRINNKKVNAKETSWDYKDSSKDVAEAIAATTNDKDLEKILSSLASK